MFTHDCRHFRQHLGESGQGKPRPSSLREPGKQFGRWGMLRPRNTTNWNGSRPEGLVVHDFRVHGRRRQSLHRVSDKARDNLGSLFGFLVSQGASTLRLMNVGTEIGSNVQGMTTVLYFGCKVVGAASVADQVGAWVRTVSGGDVGGSRRRANAAPRLAVQRQRTHARHPSSHARWWRIKLRWA